MPEPTARITLTREMATLFIPLYSKALESRRRPPILEDPKAEAILAQVDYDFAALRTPVQSRLTVAMRAKKLDACVRDFLARHPSARVLHLGCGLDSRVLRVAPRPLPWYDLDFPEVIDLRRRFYTESDWYHMLGASVTDPAWLEAVAGEGPAIIIAEGLLMYLTEAEVRTLVTRLRARFPGSELAADVFSVLTAQRVGRHPGLRHTGAQVRWGVDDARAVEAWAPGIQLIEEWPFTASDDIPNLTFGERFMFRVMGAFRAAQMAHRIVRYQLG